MCGANCEECELLKTNKCKECKNTTNKTIIVIYETNSCYNCVESKYLDVKEE